MRTGPVLGGMLLGCRHWRSLGWGKQAILKRKTRNLKKKEENYELLTAIQKVANLIEMATFDMVIIRMSSIYIDKKVPLLQIFKALLNV